VDFQRLVSRAVFGIFAIILAPVLSEFFIELARTKGIYDDPEKTLSKWITFLVNFASQEWYPYVLGGAAGLLCGVWLDRLSRRVTKRATYEKAHLSSLSVDLYAVKQVVKSFNAPMKGYPRMRTSIPQNLTVEEAARVRSLFVSLNDFGIQTPMIPDLVGREIALSLEEFLAIIDPFVAKNQRLAAEKEAIRFVKARTDQALSSAKVPR
jgi:hypothetical protein